MSNPDPRIAPKEMIVTRYKSAQQKMQLREKDRSMTKITDLLKSPTNRTVKTRKRNKKASPNIKKVLLQDSGNEPTQYYPEKLRRKFEERRVFLQPKYESTTIVKLNKRKLGTPRRGFSVEGNNSSPSTTDQALLHYQTNRSLSPAFDQLSLAELVRLVEDTDGLDDDDLMEILTCPSPVWWEDPPDENYIEEPIFKRNSPDTSESKQSRKDKCEEMNNIPIVKEIPPDIANNIEVHNKDDRFLKKRSKLENLLGNIKNKTFKTKDVNETAKPNNTEKDTLKEAHRDDIPKPKSPLQAAKEKNNSESNESLPDLSFVDEELLNDFENIDIPIEAAIVANKEIKEIAQEKRDDSLNNEVPIILPPLIRRPTINTEVIETDASSSPVQENVDTISDTNIKFISDEDDSHNKQEETKTEESHLETKSEILKAIEKQDFITVYKIVQSDVCGVKESFADKLKNIPEYSSYVDKLWRQEGEDGARYDGQLNSFFKKCKNVYRKKKSERLTPESDSQLCGTCEPKKSTIDIAQDENVKYCLNCSSIFDTDECSYCIHSKPDKDTEIAENLT